MERAMSEIVETQSSKIWLGEDGIVHIEIVVPNLMFTGEHAVENLQAIKRVNPNSKSLVLTDMRNVIASTREAREYGRGREFSSSVRAVALLVGSSISRMVGRFFIQTSRLSYPAHVSSSEAEAIEWLNEFRE